MSTITAAHASTHDREIIALMGLVHGTSHFFHLLLPPLFPWLMKDFQLSYTEAGLLMTVFFVISGVGQALAGFVVDKLGARPVLFFGLGMLALSGVMLALSQNYAMLVLTAALAGVGNSIFHPADFTLLNRRVSPPRLGHAFSVHGLSGNIGWAAAPVVLAGIAGLTDWHWAGVFAAVLAAGVWLVCWQRRAVLHDTSEHSTENNISSAAPLPPTNPAPRLGFLAVGAVWMCFAFFFIITLAFAILQHYGPALFRALYGVNLGLATSALTAFLLGGAAGMLVGGFIATQRQDNDRVIAVAMGTAAFLATCIAMTWIPAWSLIPVLVMMGFATGIAGPNRDLLVRRAATSRFGRASFGRIYGFVYSGLDTGLAVGPIIFGPLMDAGRYSVVLLALALLYSVSVGVALSVGQVSREGG